MEKTFSPSAYEELIAALFVRFPSFQKVGGSAYKPGIQSMEFFDQLTGHPHRKYKIIHVAGTNGKGSVSNMLASALAASGLKIGLYTSPHILDFRERMRTVCEGENGRTILELISKEYVWDFVQQWSGTFDHLNMSFFEITTSMAFSWFAAQAVDVVVLETGLGGRLDSTNIVSPVLSVITNIGLDHCDMLGETLGEIAFEKAGIIKPLVPAVVGESNPETDAVFERKILYTNLSELKFMGQRTEIMKLLTFADKVAPTLWDEHREILAAMDLQGEYQAKNLRTVLTALDVLAESHPELPLPHPELFLRHPELDSESPRTLTHALIHTASRTQFHGRWETLSDTPRTICDIGHNEHGLKYNFAQLSKMKEKGECSGLIIIYGSVADKDVDAVLHLMPEDAAYIFTQAQNKRALAASDIRDKFLAQHPDAEVYCIDSVKDAMAKARELAVQQPAPLIYIGGSTYIVSEAVASVN